MGPTRSTRTELAAQPADSLYFTGSASRTGRDKCALFLMKLLEPATKPIPPSLCVSWMLLLYMSREMRRSTARYVIMACSKHKALTLPRGGGQT